MEATTQDTTAKRAYREVLTLYHPTAKQSGAALRLEPCLGREGRANCFFLEMAGQKPDPEKSNKTRGNAAFDWENKITVKLGFADICELLAVLEDRKANAGDARNGLYHQSGKANTMIRFERHEAGGVALALSRKREGEEQPKRIWTVLSPIEAIGIRHILSTGLFFMYASGTRSDDAAG